MVSINPETLQIELSRGDNVPLVFNFKQNGSDKILTENVILTIKKKAGGGYPALITKVYQANGVSSIPFTITMQEIIAADIKAGIYYYDLYLESSKHTAIPPTQFIVKEVVHDFN